MSRKASPRIDDVAALAGVSTATVSRFLNVPHRVSEETGSKIKQAVAELSYTPHYGGRVLASNRTNTVGAIIPTMENAIFARGIQAMQEALASEGLVLLVASSNYDEGQELSQIKALINQGVECLVLIGTYRSQESYDYMTSRGVPFVVTWAYEEGFPYPCVGFDNFQPAKALTELVLSKGHKNIAMIAGVSANNDRARDRIAGTAEALETAGCLSRSGWLIEADYSFEAAAEAFAQLLKLESLPDAIVCGNDVLAAGVLMAARAQGFSVPQDFSVVGYDDIDLSLAVSPPLTTVHVPHRQMGRNAAQAVCKLIKGQDLDPIPPLETYVVERESLGEKAK